MGVAPGLGVCLRRIGPGYSIRVGVVVKIVVIARIVAVGRHRSISLCIRGLPVVAWSRQATVHMH